MTLEHTEQLRTLLQRRLDIIGDHDLRLRAPEEQLKALQTVSNAPSVAGIISTVRYCRRV